MCLILACSTDNLRAAGARPAFPRERRPAREPCPEACLAAIVQVNSLRDAALYSAVALHYYMRRRKGLWQWPCPAGTEPVYGADGDVIELKAGVLSWS
jgi:hypothetical protein